MKAKQVTTKHGPLSKVSWAGQTCEVLEETPSKIKIRFSNATGTAEFWLSRSANLYKI